ncbi:T9SS type A sorting domain-containing protein [Dyadobacter sp. BHUBP1]|uniref:T9SS type A sorting domain-containing protein n=1 Tax=Dyadobacter sp. BHUBP1 TaxID=3424178 RepID=UPI003D34FEA6
MKNLYKCCITAWLLAMAVAGFCQTGIVETDRSATRGLVSFPATAKLTGIGNAKHVNGYVEKTGTGSFLYPVGHKGVYRPFGADGDGITGAYFLENPETATLPAGGPFATSSREGTVKTVSTAEYWDIDGANASRITLTWNAASNVGALTGNSLTMLGIVGWNTSTSRWEPVKAVVDEVAHQGGISNLTAGSITTVQTVVPSTYSIYTLAALNSAALPTNYIGSLENVACTTINGWVWDKNYPDVALTVELVEGSTVLATARADQYRADLKNNGTGTGNYGFTIPTPGILLDGTTHQLSIRVKGSSTLITGSPKALNCTLGGSFEGTDCYTLNGWAWDKNNPGDALTVVVKEGSTTHTTAVANIFRQDLKNNGTGTGNYGFKIPLPAVLRDGNTHQISISLQNLNYTLPNSPKPVNCPVNQYIGRFENADCNYIQGWVWDKNYPNSALTVEIYEGSTVYATGTANIYREALKTAGYGTGNYVFKIPTPAALWDGKSHQLSVRVKGTTAPLSDSPRTLSCSVNQYAGSFEWFDCESIKGWAWNKNAPNNAVEVELYEGTTVYASTVANIYRDDLKANGTGTGNYGFRMPMPAALKDGQNHSVNIRVKGSTTVLSNSPRVVNCAVNNYEGRMETPDCSYIQGWVWDKNFPGNALTVEIYEGSTVYATGTANIYRDALKTAGKGTGNYGFKIPTPAALMDGKTHQVGIRVKGSAFTLTDSPRALTCAVNQYAGSFEWFDCDAIKGWVWDKNAPNSAVTVEVYEGTTVYATAIADQYREDLKNAGIGTGNYGFRIAMPAALKDGQNHNISIRVKASTVVLNNSPRAMNCPVNAYEGRFETADCGFIAGWVWDKNFPANALTVEIIEGTIVHATGVANIYRESLKTGGIGTGNYAFKIATPMSLMDGKAHQLSVRVKGTTFALADSPRALTCAVNQYAGSFEWFDCESLKGWAWDKNFPNNAVTVELYEGTTVYATAVADQYREDLKNAGTGTGNYGFKITMPTALKDGQNHALSIRVKGSTTILNNSPRTTNCPVNAYAGRVETPSCSYINGWVWDKNFPANALTVEVFEGTTVLATGIANIYREALKTSGIGTGNYVFKIATPAAIKDGKAHTFGVRVKGTTFTLTDSPRTLTCTATGRIAAPEEMVEIVPETTGPEWKDDARLVMAPNPTRGQMTAIFQLNNKQRATMEVFNLAGQRIWTGEVAGKGGTIRQAIDLGTQPDGTYLFQLRRGAMILTRRIILVK